MSERLRRSRRILAVQTQLDKLAEWGLIDLETQAAILKDQQCALINFLSGESEVAGIFSTTMMRRLQSIAERLATIAIEREAQKDCHRDERRRLRCAERTVAILESEERREEAQCQLAEVIEAALQRGSRGS